MIVFTNGCFDILHPGHIDLLERAKALGSKLIVGINSDQSVRAIKGAERPLLKQEDRKKVLLGLKSVDEVIIFDELTPENIIKKIKPDILIKGGDWSENEIIGADFVKENGGKVFSLPLLGDYSTSKIVEKINKSEDAIETKNLNTDNKVVNSLKQHLDVVKQVLQTDVDNIEKCAGLISETFKHGGKVLICGNGGSAADSQHIAAEFVGRFETERDALPAIALTTDTSALTALANDYNFERVYARQVEALANTGDCLIAISTSGNSPNIIAAVMTARKKGCRVIGMTGENGKKLASLSDAAILIPSSRTARIQEVHITIAHIWCELIDENYTDK